MRDKAKKMLPISVIIVITLITSMLAYKNIVSYEEIKCWNLLEDSANSVNNELRLRIKDNINILRLAAGAMIQEKKVNSYDSIRGHINDFKDMTIFSRIDVLYPDNTLFLQSGETKKISNNISFDNVVAKGEHISTRTKDFKTGREVLYYFAPVKEHNKTIAMIVGVIDCLQLNDIIKTSIYDGNANVFIVDRRDGNFVMDNWHNKLSNILDLGERKQLKGYENVDAVNEIIDGKTNTVAFVSDSNSKVSYMYYTPIDNYSFELLVVVKEDIAFSSLINLKQMMIIIGIVELLLLLTYFLWNLYTMNQLVKTKTEISKQLEISTTLIECVAELSSNKDIDISINNLLTIINKFFKGDRTYIFEIDYENNLTHNTYEYTANGVIKEIDNLKDVPLDIIDYWLKRFKETGIFYISDVETETKEQYPDACEVLVAQNITNLIAVPLIRDDKIIGFLGVDNPKKSHNDFSLLTSIQFFVTNSLIDKLRQEHLKYLSYNDILTKLYNRNKYIKVVESYTDIELKDVGIAYLDLNGLKSINDNYGHEAGDNFIKKAAREIFNVFPKDSYRIGGDEFVILTVGISKKDFDSKIAELKEIVEKKDISISFGVLWVEDCQSLEKTLKKVDKLMYEDKDKFYRENNLDRRKHSN